MKYKVVPILPFFFGCQLYSFLHSSNGIGNSEESWECIFRIILEQIDVTFVRFVTIWDMPVVKHDNKPVDNYNVC